MPSYFSNRRRLSPSVASPLAKAYDQEAAAASVVDQQAKEQDTILQAAKNQQDFQQQQEATARKAAAAQRAQTAAAKKAGVQTQVDPTGNETIARHEDGRPKWEPGFTAAPKPTDQGAHVVPYRDPYGQITEIPLDKINRTKDATGTEVDEFDIPDANGQPQRIRRPVSATNPLFKVDPTTGDRYTEASDPATGGLVRQKVGIDPAAKSAALINRRKEAYAAQKEQATFAGQAAMAEQNVIEETLKPVKAKLTEARQALKRLNTGPVWVNDPARGPVKLKSANEPIEYGLPAADDTEKAQADAYFKTKQQTEQRLAQIKAEHDPIKAQIDTIAMNRAKLAQKALLDGHRLQIELADMEKAAKAGVPVYEPDWKKKFDDVKRDPRLTRLYTEAEHEATGSPLAADLATATDQPELTTASKIFRDLAQARQDENPLQGKGPLAPGVLPAPAGIAAPQPTMQDVIANGLTAGSTDPKQAKIDAASAPAVAAKAFGIKDPAKWTAVPQDNGNLELVHADHTDMPSGQIDPQNNRISLYPNSLLTNVGRDIIQTAAQDGMPVYVYGAKAPLSKVELTGLVAQGIAASKTAVTPDQAAVELAKLGLSPDGLRERFKNGEISAQDARLLNERIAGVSETPLDAASFQQGFAKHLADSPIDAFRWQNGTVDDKRAVVNRYSDNTLQKAAYGNLVIDRNYNAQLRHTLLAPLKDSLGKSVWTTAKQGVIPSLSILAQLPRLSLDAIGVQTESGDLAAAQWDKWKQRVPGYLDHVRARPEVEKAFAEYDSWAATAPPDSDVPEEIAAKIAKVAFNTYHQLTPEDAKANDTTEETFDINKNPMLKAMSDRFLETSDPAMISQLLGTLMLDQKDRDIAAKVQKYVERTRVATLADVVERSKGMGLNLDAAKASAVMDLGLNLERAKTREQADAIYTQASKILGTKGNDTAYAMSLLTTQASDDPNSMTALARGGFSAGYQEILSEVPLAAAEYAIMAASGATATPEVMAARAARLAARTGFRATAARWVAAKGAAIAEDFPKMAALRARTGAAIRAEQEAFAKAGILKPKHGKPLTTAQKAQNLAVGTAKTLPPAVALESIEGGFSAIGEADPTLKGTTEQMGQEGLGALFIMPIFGGVNVVTGALRQRSYDAESVAELKRFTDDFNQKMAAVPGFKPVDPSFFEAAEGIMASPTHVEKAKNLDGALKRHAAIQAEEAALAKQAKSSTVTPDASNQAGQTGASPDEAKSAAKPTAGNVQGDLGGGGAQDQGAGTVRAPNLVPRVPDVGEAVPPSQKTQTDVRGAGVQQDDGGQTRAGTDAGVATSEGTDASIGGPKYSPEGLSALSDTDLLVAHQELQKNRKAWRDEGKMGLETAVGAAGALDNVEAELEKRNIPASSAQPAFTAEPFLPANVTNLSDAQVEIAEHYVLMKMDELRAKEGGMTGEERRDTSRALNAIRSAMRSRTIQSKTGGAVPIAEAHKRLSNQRLNANDLAEQLGLPPLATPENVASEDIPFAAPPVSAPSARLLEAEMQVTLAAQEFADSTASAITAMNELRNLDPKERPLYTAAAKIAAGGTVFTVEEAKATIALNGANAAKFEKLEAPLPAGVAGPRQLKSLTELPDVTPAGPNRYRLPEGVTITLPDTVIAGLMERAPSLATLIAPPQALSLIAKNTGAKLGLQPADQADQADQAGQATAPKSPTDTIKDVLADNPKLATSVEFVEKYDQQQASGGMWTEDDGTIKIHLPTIELQMRALRIAPEKASEHVFGMMDEEIIHKAQNQVARDRHKKIAPERPFIQWRNEYYGAMWRTEFNAEQQQAARDAYGKGTGPDGKLVYTLDSKPDWIKAYEGIRMLGQVGSKWGKITEAVLKELEEILRVLREMIAKPSAAIKAEIDSIRAVLEEYGYDVADPPRSSTQFTLNPADAKPVIDFAKAIPDAELATDVPSAAGAAREDEPHITVLYGLTEHEAAPVQAAIADHGPVTVTLGKVSMFENEKYDVLKVDVSGDSLHELNAKVAKLPNANTYPDYKPHMTIAYLKKGEGKKYVGNKTFEGKKLTFDTVTFSPPKEMRGDIGKPELSLTGKPATDSAQTGTKSVPLTQSIPIGKGQYRTANFASEADAEAFNLGPQTDAANNPNSKLTPAERTAILARGKALRDKIVIEAGKTKPEAVALIAGYNEAVTNEAAKADPYDGFTPQTFERYAKFTPKEERTSTLKTIAKDKLKDPTGQDIISQLKELGRLAYDPETAKSAEWEWYLQLEADAKNTSLTPKEVATRAAQGDVSDPATLLAWVNGNILSQEPGKGLTPDDAAMQLSSGELGQVNPVEATELGPRILEAIAQRQKAAGQPKTLDDKLAAEGDEVMAQEDADMEAEALRTGKTKQEIMDERDAAAEAERNSQTLNSAPAFTIPSPNQMVDPGDGTQMRAADLLEHNVFTYLHTFYSDPVIIAIAEHSEFGAKLIPQMRKERLITPTNKFALGNVTYRNPETKEVRRTQKGYDTFESRWTGAAWQLEESVREFERQYQKAEAARGEQALMSAPATRDIAGVPAADIFASTKQRHGITHDIDEAGYVLPDGTMLDFTGRADAGYVKGKDLIFRPKAGERDWMRGQRGMDHREIEWEGQPPYKESFGGRMIDFMRLGAVRMDRSGAISIHGRYMPTAAQLRVLKDLVTSADGASLDLEDQTGKRAAVTIEGPKFAKIKGIMQRWANGEDIAESQSLFSAPATTIVEPGFYSQLREAIAAKMPARSNRATLKGIIANSNIKADELKWTGVIPWIESQPEPITREQVFAHLEGEGAVRFQEVRLGNSSHPEPSAPDYYNSKGFMDDNGNWQKYPDQVPVWNDQGFKVPDENGKLRIAPFVGFNTDNDPVWLDADGFYWTFEEEPEGLFRASEKTPDLREGTENNTKFSQYQLPGGTNYREIVLAMPAKNDGLPEGFKVIEKDGGFGIRFPNGSEIGGWSTREAAAKSQSRQEGAAYTSSHFPDVPNYVAHMRTNERTDAEGKPGLFIEEIQSDRHQAGREKGYGPKYKAIVRIAKGRESHTAAFETRDEAFKAGQEKGGTEDTIEIKEMPGEGVPDAPFRTTWPLQMFKRALKDAVESGKDWIGFTTGQTQAERYDLSKQVSEIRYRKSDQTLQAWKTDIDTEGYQEPVIEQTTPLDKLAEFIGKDAAQKIADSEPGKDGWVSLKGQDLKVGGSGMLAFYDSILPKEIGKYVKQWGAKVNQSEIGGNGNLRVIGVVPVERGYGVKMADGTIKEGWPKRESAEQYMSGWNAELDKTPNTPIWRINITPAMSEGVAKGQALFSAPALQLDANDGFRDTINNWIKDHPKNWNELGELAETLNARLGNDFFDHDTFDSDSMGLRTPFGRILASNFKGHSDGDHASWLVPYSDGSGRWMVEYNDERQKIMPSLEAALLAMKRVDADAQLFSAPARAYESMDFDPPFRAPFGEITSYNWMSKPVGQMEGQRVSDWNQSRLNPVTGRPIVHHFKVRNNAGEMTTVSLETAMGQLSDQQRTKLTGIIRSEQKRREDAANGQMSLFSAPATVWHSSVEPITDRTDGFGIHFGTKEQADARAGEVKHLSGNESESRPFSIDLKNPFRATDQGDYWKEANWLLDALAKAENPELGAMSPAEFAAKAWKDPARQALGKEWDAIYFAEGQKNDGQTNRLMLEKRGYDGIVYANEFEGVAAPENFGKPFMPTGQSSGDSFIVFNPSAIRPAEQSGLLASAPASDRTPALEAALAQMPEHWRYVLQATWAGQSVAQIASKPTPSGLTLSEIAVTNILRSAQGRLNVLMAAQDGTLKAAARVVNDPWPGQSNMEFTRGRPDLAGGAETHMNALDIVREAPEVVTHDEMNELANRMFAIDPAAAERMVVRWMDSGTQVIESEGLSPALQAIMTEAHARKAAHMLMTAAAKMLTTRSTLRGGDPIQTARLIHAYRNTGTEQARALGMRRDPFKTPAERHAMFIAEAIYTPPENVRNEIRDNPENKDKLLAAWAIEADKLKQKLKAKGYDIDAAFAALNAKLEAQRKAEQEVVEAEFEAIPTTVAAPLAKADPQTKTLVKAILEGQMTPRQAANAAGLTLEAAKTAFAAFRAKINAAGVEAAERIKKAILGAAPAADYAAQIGIPFEDIFDAPDVIPVKTQVTQKITVARQKKAAVDAAIRNDTTPIKGELDLADERQVAQIARDFSAAKSTFSDKMLEFWRASILSGPMTQTVNFGSSFLYGFYETTFKKLGTAALADAARMFGMKPDAASLADVPAMAAAVIPALQQAFKDAIKAWSIHDRVFNHFASNTQRQLGLGGIKIKAEDEFEPALSGPVGTVMHGISFRLMLLADEFVKSFYGRIEVAQQARQIARSENLKGQAFADRILELMQPGSRAWIKSLDQSLKIGFQTKLGTGVATIDMIDGFATWLKGARHGPNWLKNASMFVLPFIDTPTNLFKQGMTMSPMGTFLALADATRALRHHAKGNHELARKIYNAQRLFDDAINQTVAWGATLAIAALVKPDGDDDKLPWITGTMPWRSTSKSERDNAYRTAPPQSIRIGDRWYSYARLDPFASALALTADSVEEFYKGDSLNTIVPKIGRRMLDNMQDKTFLQGLSDVMNAIEDPERFGTRWATNIVTGFIPNLIRQPLRAEDENLRNTDIPKNVGFLDAIEKRIGYSVNPQSAPLAINVWGEPATKNTGTGPNTDILLRLFSPVQTQRADNIKPLDIKIRNYNAAHEKPLSLTVPDSRIDRPSLKLKIDLNEKEREELATKVGKMFTAALGTTYDAPGPLTERHAKEITDIHEKVKSLNEELVVRKWMETHPR